MMTKNNLHSTPIGVARQLQLLLELGTADATSISEVARESGISDQGLTNLLEGKATNPRLYTLLALCRYYGISLDYFACETEQACRAYLSRHCVRNAPTLVEEIAYAAAHLSPRGQRNVLTIMEWMRLAADADR